MVDFKKVSGDVEAAANKPVKTPFGTFKLAVVVAAVVAAVVVVAVLTGVFGDGVPAKF